MRSKTWLSSSVDFFRLFYLFICCATLSNARGFPSNFVRYSVSGCTCISVCAPSLLRAEPWCHIRASDCRNKAAVSLERTPFTDFTWENSVEDLSAGDVNPQRYAVPNAQQQLQSSGVALAPFIDEENDDSLHHFFRYVSAVLSTMANRSSVYSKRQLEGFASEDEVCECKEDIVGVWDYCIPPPHINPDPFVDGIDATLDDQYHYSWSRSSSDSGTWFNQQKSELISHFPNGTPIAELPLRYKKRPLLEDARCHPTCLTCINAVSPIETACLECRNTTQRSFQLILSHSSSTHGSCLPITNSVSHCHASCALCLDVGSRHNASSCVSCPAGASFVPGPSANVGECIDRQSLAATSKQSLRSATSTNVSAKLPSKQNTFWVDSKRRWDALFNDASSSENATYYLNLVNNSPTTAQRAVEVPGHGTEDAVTAYPSVDASETVQIDVNTSNARFSPVFSRQLPEYTLEGQQQKQLEKPDGGSDSNRKRNLVLTQALTEHCALISKFLNLPLPTKSPEMVRSVSYATAAKRYWTQLVYLQADTNIQDSAIANLDEMLHPITPNDFEPHGHFKHPADYMHLVLLLDTRQILDVTTKDATSIRNAPNKSHSKRGVEGSKQFFPSSNFRLNSHSTVTLLSQLQRLVVCPTLPVSDNVRHHTIDPDRGEAFELYRVPGYDATKKSLTDGYQWLLLRRRGEVDMNDPFILSDFISRSIRLFPAYHVSLVFWNHGAAWRGIGDDDDNSDGEGMTLTMIAKGLDEGLEHLRQVNAIKRLTLLGFDACLMSEFTVVDSLASYTEYFLASQDNEPARGWNWRYLNPVVAEKQFSEVSQPTALKEYRQATPAEYASWIIDGYAASERNTRMSDGVSSDRSVTLSLIEISLFEQFRNRFNLICELLYLCGGHRISTHVKRAVSRIPPITGCAEVGLCSCVDMNRFLTSLMEELLAEGMDRKIVSELAAARELYHNMVIYTTQRSWENILETSPFRELQPLSNEAGKSDTSDSGLSLYFPSSEEHCTNDTTSNKATASYYRRLFQTTWSNFVSRVTGGERGKECTAYYPSARPTQRTDDDTFYLPTFFVDQYTKTPSNENHAGVTSVNISVVPVGTLSPTYSVVFSAWVHQVPVATRSLVGVTLDRLPSHLVTRPTGTQATVLLTREVLREIRQPSQHIKSYTSDAYTAQKMESRWDLSHFVLMQLVQDADVNETVASEDGTTQRGGVIAPLFALHVRGVTVNMLEAQSLKGNAQKTQVLHDVHLASVKYYATMHDVVEDAFEMGYLVFRWPSDTMTLELILRHSDGWKLQPKLAEGFLRPVLYIARAEERIRIVKASEGRLMTGATTPRRTVLSAIDSRALFEWNDAVLQTYTTAPSKSLKAFSLNVQKLDHSSFLSRVLFPPDRGPVNDDTYRGVVGFGVRPVDEPQWNLYLFSVPKVENNWPFCSSPYRLSRVAWWDNNGVCDILEGKHVCDAIQNNRSQSLKFEKRAAAETNSLDPDRVYPLGNKTTETFVAQRLFSVEGSELLDCAALHTSGWLVPLVKATSGELNPNPYALTVTSRTASSEADSRKCKNCGAHSVCQPKRSPVDGSITWGCECKSGYALSGSNAARTVEASADNAAQNCVDVNECEMPLVNGAGPCGEGSICVNLPGSYACLCTLGYVENDVTLCVREDECVGRDRRGQCLCLPGFHSFAENSDHEQERLNLFDPKEAGEVNFRRNMTLRGRHYDSIDSAEPDTTDMRLLSECYDIDECAFGIASCDNENAKCFNLKGGYACLCQDGFEGDGRTCFAGSPSVTVTLRIVEPYYYSFSEAASVKVANQSTTATTTVRSQIDEWPTRFWLAFWKDNETESIFATALSQALGISRWRVRLAEPLGLMQSLSSDNSAPSLLTLVEHIKSNGLPVVYRCVLRILASAPLHVASGNDVFEYDESENPISAELTSYEAALELRHQLSLESVFTADNAQEEKARNDSPSPLRNPAVVGPGFARLAKHTIFDEYRFDKAELTKSNKLTSFWSSVVTFFQNIYAWIIGYFKRLSTTEAIGVIVSVIGCALFCGILLYRCCHPRRRPQRVP